ncbi:MAG: alanine racemase [Spirochaetales bacterium]|nr:alanine racemase [Spirochaetales bacterium]
MRLALLVYHPAMRNCRAVIHLQNLHSNLASIRTASGGRVRLCLMVKADGYGHGAVGIAQAAVKMGIDCFGVVTAGEALELRAAGITAQVLLLGLAAPRECIDMVKYGISAVVADEDLIRGYAAAAKAAGAVARLHLKIDTGMGTIGCTPERAPVLARLIAGTPGLSLEGICSHFPVADDADTAYTDEQIRRFSRCIGEIRKAGISPGTVHLANSAAHQRFPESWFDMVRLGIAAYGYPGAPERDPPLLLKPVMEVRAPVSFIKRVPAGTALSYGHTFTTGRSTIIATVSAGYADGYRRGLSNRGRVLINGTTYPVVGTICMDKFLADLGPDSDVKQYDEVTLFGPDRSGPDAAELASILHTIPYEITCGINTRVPRTYVD